MILCLQDIHKHKDTIWKYDLHNGILLTILTHQNPLSSDHVSKVTQKIADQEYLEETSPLCSYGQQATEERDMDCSGKTSA